MKYQQILIFMCFLTLSINNVSAKWKRKCMFKRPKVYKRLMEMCSRVEGFTDYCNRVRNKICISDLKIVESDENIFVHHPRYDRIIAKHLKESLTGCVSTPFIKHGIVVKMPSYTGATRKFACSDPYVMEGESKSTCLESGKWSSPLPQCVIKKCPTPELTDNGKVRYATSRRIGSTATYVCWEGHEIKSGSNTMICNESGKWSGVTPKCEPVECEFNFASGINNLFGTIRLEGEDNQAPFKYNEEVRMVCNQGFKIKGQAFLRCGANGKWPELPECIPV